MPEQFSYHMPIIVSLITEYEGTNKRIGLLPKLYWSKNYMGKYKERLESEIKHVYLLIDDIKVFENYLLQCIRNSARIMSVKINGKRRGIRQD